MYDANLQMQHSQYGMHHPAAAMRPMRGYETSQSSFVRSMNPQFGISAMQGVIGNGTQRTHHGDSHSFATQDHGLYSTPPQNDPTEGTI